MRFIAVRTANMRASGFSLIELVILLTIMSIMSVLALTRMPSVDLFKANNFSSTLLYDLNLTKVLSMTQNQPYSLVIGAASYQIQDQTNTAIVHPESTSTTTAIPAGTTVGCSYILNSVITACPTTTQAGAIVIILTFNSLGQPSNAGTTLTLPYTLTVTSGTASQVITISPQTGFIK